MSFVFLPEDSTGKTDAENSFQLSIKAQLDDLIKPSLVIMLYEWSLLFTFKMSYTSTSS